MSALRQRMARLLAGWAARLAPALPETPVRRVRLARLATFGEGRYRSPLEVLAETWSRPVETLADELRCSKRQAFELQQEAAKAALPYWHQRLTPDAQDVADGLVPLVIQVGAQASATVAADGMLGMQNQILSRRAAAVSDGEASDGAGEAVDPAAETGGEDANG